MEKLYEPTSIKILPLAQMKRCGARKSISWFYSDVRRDERSDSVQKEEGSGYSDERGRESDTESGYAEQEPEGNDEGEGL
jgi:hypothetical protein